MTKKEKSSKKTEKEFRPFRFQSLNERLNNININVVHRIRYFERTEINDDGDLIRSSHFHDALEHWSMLNFSETYTELYKMLTPLSGSLEQIVFNRDRIVEILRKSLEEQKPLVIESLLDLIVQLSRDLQSDFYIYYKKFLFVDIIQLLLNRKEKNVEIDTQRLEQVFQCLTYLFKYLWRIMLKDLAELYELYSKFLFSTKSNTKNFEYIRSFAAESFGYLLRKIENYQPFIDYLFDLKDKDENEVESLAIVFSETCRNVQSTFHSCTKTLICCLLKKFLEKPNELDLCLKRIYSLLIEHTNRENVSVLWICLIEIYQNVDHENCSSMIHRTFYDLIQCLIDHQMIVNLEFCWQLLSEVKQRNDDEFFIVHYRTMLKLFERIPIDEKGIEIYFRFASQTSGALLYHETKTFFENHRETKFFDRFWNELLKKELDDNELIEFLVDFILFERKNSQLILLSKDDDETIRTKFDLLKQRKTSLNRLILGQTTIDSIRSFIQRTIEKLPNIEVLTNGDLWSALLLFNCHPQDIVLDREKLQEIPSMLMEKHFVSPMISLTLIELLNFDFHYSSSFFIFLLEKDRRSELNLLFVRLALIKNRIDEEFFQKFFDLLKENLSSIHSTIRLTTLEILSSLINNENHPIKHCLNCEKSPLNVYEYRQKLISLQKLSLEFLLKEESISTSIYLSMFYLLGLLRSNFTPLWSISIDLIGSYGRQALNKIDSNQFWFILNEQFHLKNHPNENELISNRFLQDYLQWNKEKDFEIKEDSIDFIQYRLNLFEILNQFPLVCEQKTKVIFPMIFDFFSNEFYDHFLSLGIIDENSTSFVLPSTRTISKRLSRKISVKTLETMLNLVKQFRHYHQWFDPERIYQFYVRLLLSADSSIQQLAFECLLNCLSMPQSMLRNDFLPHVEKIFPLFHANSCRKAFHDLIQGVLLDSTQSDSLKQQLAFLLIRILYSKLNEKRSLGSTTRSRKDYLKLNQKYLFQFLITFASNPIYSNHFLFFIQLILQPFATEIFHDDWLKRFESKISNDHQQTSLISFEFFLKYLQHSLTMLKTFLHKLGVYIQQQIDFVLRFYILTVKFVEFLARKTFEDENVQTKKLRILFKRIRSMSYKGFQNIFELFDQSEIDLFDNKLIDDLWFSCVRENYLDDILMKNKTREDFVHLLKLLVVWSRSHFLKKTFFHQREDFQPLIKYLVDYLNENSNNENKKFIVEFIWNLLQLDPDDSFVLQHKDSLLNYLTKISSSMIDSTSTMSLTSQEFDILLVLTKQPSNLQVIEQLTSIFIRLLRQNVLTKKKKILSKQTNQLDFNSSTLQILQNLITKIENPTENYLHFLPILCLKITQRDQRIQLMKLFQTFIDRSTDESSKTNWCLKKLLELNCWNPNQIDEPDYEIRLKSYKEIVDDQEIDENKQEYFCLFYHFLYELEHSTNDLSLREFASQSLRLFLEKSIRYQNYFLVELRSILKQTFSSSNVRHEFLRHLSSLIDFNQNNEDLIDLKRLRHYSDVELDFFNNIIHVQHHRRFRALKRLKSIDEQNHFRSTTIENYLLPIVCSFINEFLNGEIQELQDEIIFQCLTNFSQRLIWSKYNQLFISYFRQLTAKNRTFNLIQKRCLTRTVSAIIDGFHFQIIHDQSKPEVERIGRTIEKRVLPMILNLLSENSFSIDSLTSNGISTKNATIDDQRQQAVLITTTCSLIATKLLVLFPNQFVEQHISTILLHIISLLRSRIYSIRDQARDCLSKCVQILGKRYFKYVVEELIAGLQRGYQHFVLLHTIHSLLIHISTLNENFNLDSAVKVIINLFVDDYFNKEKTESSKESEHENSSYKPSNIPEAKTNKTANVMELLGRLIQSSDQLLICIDPFRQQLSINNESKDISKCEKCLQRFQTGLINNSHLSMEILFIFVHHLLTKTEETENEKESQDKQKNLVSKFINERENYHLIPNEPKRGHARVAQAIHHGKKTNLHCLTAWTLNLLHKLIKKYKNDEEKFLSMIDPFTNHIEISLNSSYTDVVVASLRNLSSLLEYSLPSLNKQRITTIYKKVFDLLKLYSSVAGSNDLNDLLTLSYKILGIFVQRSTKDNVELTNDEYLCLFTYIESDLLNVHRQSSAFLLLRSIMRHSTSRISTEKLLRTQLDDLLRSRLQSMIVQSSYDHIRSSCREIFHIYLFSYEHTKSKLKSYFDFFLLNLDYETFHGRQSVLMLLHSIFNDLQKQRLNDYAAYFFVPLACHYYNETNQECKKLFHQNIQLLLQKIDDQHRNDLLKNFVLTWINDVIEHRCLAVQLFLLFIEIESDRFDQYLIEIFNFISKEINEISLVDDEEKQKFNDQYLYHLINTPIHVIKHCSNATQMLSLRSIWLQLLRLIDEKGLLHPHIWIRFQSAQLFGLLFEMVKPLEFIQSLQNYSLSNSNSSKTEGLNGNGPSPKRLKKSNRFQIENEPLMINYVINFDPSQTPLIKVQRLCLCSCSQLKPSDLSEEFRLQIVKNLIYLSKILILSKSNEFDLVVKRCCRLTTFESTKHPNEITRRTSILKWIAALIMDVSSDLLPYFKAFLTIIEREIERDETTSNLPLKTLAQDVFDVFKRQCDIHLITSIYADIAKQRRTKRLERKQKLAVLAINQPEVIYRKKRVKQTKRLGLGKKKRIKAIENAKKNRRKKVLIKSTDETDDF